MTQVWPNFYVVGAQKCGTTTLYEHLAKHPQVFVPEAKEPEFFSAAPDSGFVHGSKVCKTVDDYQRQYQPGAGYPAIGDFSTGYLWDDQVPAKIRAVTPEAKIVVMLRDPVARAHSAYLMVYRNGKDTARTFQEALERDAHRSRSSWFSAFHYVDAGLYHLQVKRYLDTFGSDRVLVLMFEDLIRQPRELLVRISRHLGIDPEPFSSLDLSEAYNQFRAPRSMGAYKLLRNPYLKKLRKRVLPAAAQNWLRDNPLFYSHKKPDLDEASRGMLERIYDSDISSLENLLSKRYAELRKSWVTVSEVGTR
jgi:hypothetical protein